MADHAAERADRHADRLRDSEALRDLVWNLPEAIYVMTAGGRIVDANPAFLALSGVPSLDAARAMDGTQWWGDTERRSEALREIARSGRLKDFEFALRRSDGTQRIVLDTCYAAADPETGEQLLYGILMDITERKEAEGELRRLATRDPLTGCYNRRFLADVTQRLGPDEVWGAIVVDVDGFKRYNDEFGHHAGDEVLVKLARFMAARVRPDDVVIRLGGDEFLILLFGNDSKFLIDVATRFRHTAPRGAPVPFSIGWAVREPGEPLEATIARADEELIHVRRRERRSSRLRGGSGGFRVPGPR